MMDQDESWENEECLLGLIGRTIIVLSLLRQLHCCSSWSRL